jgi:signal transduction histidine kinase/CheY-like chemotaxis protein
MAKRILIVITLVVFVPLLVLHFMTDAYDLIIAFILIIFIGLILGFYKALKTLESAKGEADMRTRIIVNSTPRICILFDSNHNLVDCNPATTQLLGFSTKEETLAGFITRLTETTLTYQGDGHDYVSVTDWAAAAAREGEIRFEHELEINGRYHLLCVEMKKVPYEDSFAIVGYASDVTEVRERETQLAHAIQEATRQRAEAEAANRAKSSFLSTMSHEIRTPMNAILGITEILLLNQSLAPDVREAIEKIYTSGDLLLGIINNILDLSKIEAGKLELITARYSTASLISDSAQLNVMQIGSKIIEFELQISENIPAFLIGDAMRVKQILNNLLSNAFKYTAKGTVTLSVSTYRDEYSSSDDELVLVLQISDTGQGMTKEQVDSLFNEFARFNMETNRLIEGTGLGMSITRNLIRIMNGEISIESEPGKGSTFTVSLPQKRAGDEVLSSDVIENLKMFRAGSRAQKRAQIKCEPMPYGSVLIVDDMDTNIYVAMGLMAPYKLKIDSAASGFDAVDKIKDGNVYDIIFMDHMMPKMDGIETVKLIRELGYSQPIAALTANAVLGNADLFLNNGFNDFLSKPIDMRQLDTILKKLIRDKQPPEVLAAALKAAVSDTPQQTVKLIPEGTVIPGLDITQGVGRYDNNEAIYINILRAYTASLRSVLDECSDVREDELPEYKIKVHGIKGASLNIYAEPLAAITFELEKAAACGDFEYVRQHNGSFLESGRELMQRLDELLNLIDRENPKPVKKKPDAAALKKLTDGCELYDIDEVDAAIGELERYSYESQEDNELMEWLKEKLALMQYPEIIARLENIKGE